MAKTLTVRTQSAELEALIKDFDKLSKAEQRAVLESSALGRSVDRTASKGKASFKGIGDSARSTALAIVGIGGAVGAVQKVIALASAEWDAFMARLEKAKGTQIDTATARARAIAQKPAELSKDEMDAMLKRVAANSGATLRDVYLAAGNPFSALGTLPLPALEAALTPAARFGRLTGADAGAVGELAGSLLAIIRAEQLQGAGAGEQALGFSRAVGSQMRVTDIGKQVESLAPVLGAANQMGIDRQVAAALLAWLTYQTEDTEGRKSSTAAISFMSKLMRDVDLGMDLVANTFEGRLRELAQRLAAMPVPEREKFLSGFGGEAKFQAAFGQLMTGDPAAMREIATIRGRIPRADSPAALASGREFFADVLDYKPAQVKEVEDFGKRREEAIQLDDPFAMAAAARDAVVKQLDALGEFQATSRIKKIAFDAKVFAQGGDPLAAVAAILENTRQQYQPQRTSFGQMSPEERAMLGEFGTKMRVGASGNSYVDTYRSQFDERRFQALEQSIAELRQIRASIMFPARAGEDRAVPGIVPGAEKSLVPLAQANKEMGQQLGNVLAGAIDRLGETIQRRDPSREIPPDALVGGSMP